MKVTRAEFDLSVNTESYPRLKVKPISLQHMVNQKTTLDALEGLDIKFNQVVCMESEAYIDTLILDVLAHTLNDISRCFGIDPSKKLEHSCCIGIDIHTDVEYVTFTLEGCGYDTVSWLSKCMLSKIEYLPSILTNTLAVKFHAVTVTKCVVSRNFNNYGGGILMLPYLDNYDKFKAVLEHNDLLEYRLLPIHEVVPNIARYTYDKKLAEDAAEMAAEEPPKSNVNIDAPAEDKQQSLTDEVSKIPTDKLVRVAVFIILVLLVAIYFF